MRGLLLKLAGLVVVLMGVTVAGYLIGYEAVMLSYRLTKGLLGQ